MSSPLNASIAPYPSPLNGSTRGPNYITPEKTKNIKKRPLRKKKQTACGVRLKEKQKMQKTTEEGKTSSSVDSRLKISRMTDKRALRLFFIFSL